MSPTKAPAVCRACSVRSCDNCRGCLCTHEDPQVMAAQTVALAMAHCQHALNKAGFAAVRPAFEQIAAALPVPVAFPEPHLFEVDPR